MEQNPSNGRTSKTRTYLIYAVGEIALVMIGILLALQVNNWNEGRINEQRRMTLTQSMINELALDTLILNTAISNYSTRLSQTSDFLNRILNEETTIDTIKQIVFYEFDPSIKGRVEGFNIVTFSVLQSTGQIDLFEESLQQQIVSHYGNNNMSAVDDNGDAYLDIVIRFSEKYPVGFQMIPDAHYARKTSMIVDDETDFVKGFMYLVGFKNYTFERYLEVYNERRQRSIDLIERLKSSLN